MLSLAPKMDPFSSTKGGFEYTLDLRWDLNRLAIYSMNTGSSLCYMASSNCCMNLSRLGFPFSKLCTKIAPLLRSSFSSSSRASDIIELQRRANSGIPMKLPASEDEDESLLFAVLSSSSKVSPLSDELNFAYPVCYVWSSAGSFDWSVDAVLSWRLFFEFFRLAR